MTAGNCWLSPKAEVRGSPIQGMGIFARQAVRQFERVAVFGGEIMFIDELNRLPRKLQHYPFQIEERFVLGSRRAVKPQDTDRLNHCCNPTCGFKGQIFLVAMRRIRRNEEITIDYAMVVSRSVGSRVIFEMSCRCGAENCRKRITEDDWKRPDLRKRYAGFFSQYLQEKIELATPAATTLPRRRRLPLDSAR